MNNNNTHRLQVLLSLYICYSFNLYIDYSLVGNYANAIFYTYSTPQSVPSLYLDYSFNIYNKNYSLLYTQKHSVIIYSHYSSEQAAVHVHERHPNPSNAKNSAASGQS